MYVYSISLYPMKSRKLRYILFSELRHERFYNQLLRYVEFEAWGRMSGAMQFPTFF